MPNKNFIEDMVTLAGGVLGNLAESRHELKAQAKNRAGSLARGLDLVTREEFDAAFAMLAKARTAQEELATRLALIESHLGLARGKTRPKAGGKKQVKTLSKNLPSVKTNKLARGKRIPAKHR